MKNGKGMCGGQAALEYMILFAAVAAVTLISVAAFDNNVRTTMEDFVGAAAANMAKP